MATRFYVKRTTPTISPAFSGIWAGGTNNRFDLKIDTGAGTAGTSNFVAKPASTAPGSYRNAQLISPPLPAQTISGTLHAQFRANTNNAAFTARAQIVVFVVSSNGSVVRGTLYAGDTNTVMSSVFGTTGNPGPQNRRFPRSAPLAVSPVTCQNGDRIVVEVGYYSNYMGSTSYNATVWINDNATNDLPVDETTTGTTWRGWIEFSQSLYQPQDYKVMANGVLVDADLGPGEAARYVMHNGTLKQVR